MPSLKRIIVLPRWRLPQADPGEHYAVISIGDPIDAKDPVSIPRRWGFHDAHRSYFRDIRGETMDCMTADQASAVWKFVDALPEHVTCLVIHCEAGASRSISVAMAITDTLNLGRAIIEWKQNDPHVEPPNDHVYERMARRS